MLIVFNICHKQPAAQNNKYQLSLMNPQDALHHGKGAANKSGRSL